MKLINKSMLSAVITLSTASVYYAQQVQDTVKTKSNDIEQVVLTGVADIAKDRKTPVAVSTIKEAQIVERLGNQEFPEILNTTPSVYATKGGGGFGDSKLNIRGFSQNNIAVMVNGMPVNDMEGGSVYWSNWAGLSDVTSAMQVQRGLGSSKLAIASVGGTVNIITRAADKKQGGIVSLGLGNDDYLKTLFAYNTGKSAKGWSSSFLMSRTAGSMYADGTKFEGYNYYFAVGYKKPGGNHDFQFTITGAPQWHNQRSFAISIANYIGFNPDQDGTPNRRYNSDWGYLKGEEYSARVNYYHKPVMSLNWDWTMSENSKLNTVLYGSFGRGGGTNTTGTANGKNLASFRDATTGLYNFDNVFAANQASTPDKGILIRNASINSHNWFGLISSFNHKINDNMKFTTGIDARYYYGYHYQVVTDLLGGSGYLDKANKNIPPNLVTAVSKPEASWNPFGGKIDDLNNRIGYSNDGEVLWYGAFGQFEYTNDKISAFLQGSVSNQGFQRIDNFIIDGVTTSKRGEIMNTKTGFKNLFGYNVKAGINYNIDEKHNIFGNVGYYEKQPFFNAVYRSNENVVSPDLTNEKIFGAELGYGFRTAQFNANVNLYRTTWDDRYLRRSSLRDVATNKTFYAEITGLNEVHMGVEVDANYTLNKFFSAFGMFSYGDWYYRGNATATLFEDTTNLPFNFPGTSSNETQLYLDKAKVGEAAQMTAALGFTIRPVTNLSFDTTWRSTSNLYASLDAYNFSVKSTAERGTLKLPNYNLFDLGISYRINLNNKQQYFTIRGNVYNLFDTTYIAESNTSTQIKQLSDFATSTTGGVTTTAQQKYDAYMNNPKNFYKGLDTSNQVFFGFGRTWAATLSFNF
ncbi:TonB-dependent receptor [Chryseobacterium shigense]|uniref:Outer membrane receptor proteins, mostly Fe transport n=1 Tax=Chryseobacterium shigense TaxID=297244 RepID=A0A1N7IFI7_9FLAO|nr:TonB-dependent receptor [Chryseobacterium shigense]PQA94404.1 TonB-dependent receptor [Chryseobacterium shigense]SIS35721.1 Outer membrane receptor proteins, mostly Fe transport [Chryseobacterium shigense]